MNLTELKEEEVFHIKKMEEEMRQGFMRKVYGILLSQLILTFGISMYVG